MNGPIGKQMVDTLVESQANVEVKKKQKPKHTSFLSVNIGNYVNWAYLVENNCWE